MADLFVNFIGAFVFSVSGGFYIKHRGEKKCFAEKLIVKVEEENGSYRYFTKGVNNSYQDNDYIEIKQIKKKAIPKTAVILVITNSEPLSFLFANNSLWPPVIIWGPPSALALCHNTIIINIYVNN